MSKFFDHTAKKEISYHKIIFGKVNLDGNIYTKESVNIASLDKLVSDGEIESYIIDDIGVMVTGFIDNKIFY